VFNSSQNGNSLNEIQLGMKYPQPQNNIAHAAFSKPLFTCMCGGEGKNASIKIMD
jgi:hypothetical protein